MDTKAFEFAYRLMPAEFRQAISDYSNAEEIRLRCGHKPSVLICGREQCFSDFPVTEKHLLHVIDVATGASLHAANYFFESAYLNYHGLRLGLCGHAIYKNQHLCGFSKYTSIDIRIPRHAEEIFPKKIRESITLNPSNTLIAAAPGIGKTTALRELVRLVSDEGFRISLIDERGELAGDNFEFSLGRCTDVLSFVPKAQGAAFMLRSMNPQIIAMDEISQAADIEALFEINGCGVNVFATAHGNGIQDMMNRSLYRKLFSEGFFQNLITISISKGTRKYSLERIG